MRDDSPQSAIRNPQSDTADELRQWDREIIWHGFTQMSEYRPFIIERASGCTLVDLEGREFLDGVSSLWCNVHGHRHPHLDQAVRRQLEQVAHVTSLGMSNPATIQLARRLVDLAPEGLRHVFFASDGASAVEAALKIAFQYWRQCDKPRPQKTLYVSYEGAYHGDTLGSVSVGRVEQFHRLFDPLLFETRRLPAPELYRLPAGVAPETARAHWLGQLEALLQAEGESIAAVVIEPLVQGAAGMVTHPSGYLQGVRELTRRHDVLLIADEVAVGIGRTGRMFACEHEGVTPDFLCIGKGLTGGYLPMSATLTTSEIWSAFLGEYARGRTFFHGHTYSGNPLAAAAALATLEVFEQEDVLEELPRKINHLAEHLARIAKLAHVGDVRQRGMMVGIELVSDKETKTPFPWQQRRGQRVCDYALTEGVWLRPLGNVVLIVPPLAISLEEIDRICGAVERGIQSIAD